MLKHCVEELWAKWVPLFGPSLYLEFAAFDACVHNALLPLITCRQHSDVRWMNALLQKGLPNARLLDSVERLAEINGGNPKRHLIFLCFLLLFG